MRGLVSSPKRWSIKSPIVGLIFIISFLEIHHLIGHFLKDLLHVTHIEMILCCGGGFGSIVNLFAGSRSLFLDDVSGFSLKYNMPFRLVWLQRKHPARTLCEPF